LYLCHYRTLGKTAKKKFSKVSCPVPILCNGKTQSTCENFRRPIFIFTIRRKRNGYMIPPNFFIFFIFTIRRKRNGYTTPKYREPHPPNKIMHLVFFFTIRRTRNGYTTPKYREPHPQNKIMHLVFFCPPIRRKSNGSIPPKLPHTPVT